MSGLSRARTCPRLVPPQDIRCLGSAIENQIKSGQVSEEFSPKLWINGGNISEIAQFNTLPLEKVGIEIFLGLALCQEN